MGVCCWPVYGVELGRGAAPASAGSWVQCLAQGQALVVTQSSQGKQRFGLVVKR